VSDGRYKTELCTLWQKGKCEWGADCKFAHGEAELRAAQERASRDDTFLSEPRRKRVRYSNEVEENARLRLENEKLRAQVDILLKAGQSRSYTDYDYGHRRGSERLRRIVPSLYPAPSGDAFRPQTGSNWF